MKIYEVILNELLIFHDINIEDKIKDIFEQCGYPRNYGYYYKNGIPGANYIQSGDNWITDFINDSSMFNKKKTIESTRLLAYKKQIKENLEYIRRNS